MGELNFHDFILLVNFVKIWRTWKNVSQYVYVKNSEPHT